LPGSRKIIFVHGCFWHQHANPSCKVAHSPRSNLQYWKPKLERNAKRDLEHRANLSAQGWSVLIIWECEVRDFDRIRRRLKRFLDSEK
jgi:DNA mismatch endonuclease (patch repair protein)